MDGVIQGYFEDNHRELQKKQGRSPKNGDRGPKGGSPDKGSFAGAVQQLPNALTQVGGASGSTASARAWAGRRLCAPRASMGVLGGVVVARGPAGGARRVAWLCVMFWVVPSFRRVASLMLAAGWPRPDVPLVGSRALCVGKTGLVGQGCGGRGRRTGDR